jgi:hypothetical protein
MLPGSPENKILTELGTEYLHLTNYWLTLDPGANRLVTKWVQITHYWLQLASDNLVVAKWVHISHYGLNLVQEPFRHNGFHIKNMGWNLVQGSLRSPNRSISKTNIIN